MAFSIASALVASTDRPTKTNFLKGTPAERGQIIAVALVDRAIIIPWNDGSTDQWTAANVVSKLLAEAYKGNVWLFPAFSVKGTFEATENKSDVIFGYDTVGDPVSMSEIITLTMRDSPFDVPFLNRMRSDLSENVHVFFFTQNGVIPVVDEDVKIYDVIPYKMDGNATSRITGELKFGVTQETVGEKGSHVIFWGKNFDKQLKYPPKLTVTGGTYAGTPALTPDLCSSSVLRLNGISAGTGRTIQFSVVETGLACLSWELYQQDANGFFVAPPAGWTINAANGTITVPNSVPSGLLKFAAVAKLPNGVIGQKNFEVYIP